VLEYVLDAGEEHHAVDIIVNVGPQYITQFLMACVCNKWQTEAIMLGMFE
jgi:hypothetical protein